MTCREDNRTSGHIWDDRYHSERQMGDNCVQDVTGLIANEFALSHCLIFIVGQFPAPFAPL